VETSSEEVEDSYDS
jgi:hypothetical protein